MFPSLRIDLFLNQRTEGENKICLFKINFLNGILKNHFKHLMVLSVWVR